MAPYAAVGEQAVRVGLGAPTSIAIVRQEELVGIVDVIGSEGTQ